LNSPFEVGRSITESVRFVSNIANECEQLAKLIKEELSKLLLSPEVASRYRANGDWSDAYENDESGWLCTELAASLPVVIKPKRSTGSYLVFQISLVGYGVEAVGNAEPLLHVGWWSSPIDFDGVQMGFPLASDTGLILEEGRLFKWGEPGEETEWCYSLRLTDINNPADVLLNIIRPMKALLLGSSAAQALSGTVAVIYEELQSVAGQFEALPRSRLDC